MSSKETFVMPIFATPLVYSNINVSKQVMDYIESVDYARSFNDDGSMSVNTYILEQPELKQIKADIQQVLNTFVFDVLKLSPDLKVSLLNSWVVKLFKGDFNFPHYHGNCFISGILYLRVSKTSGHIVFERNVLHKLFPGFDFKAEEHNMFNCESWTITPEPGQVIVFPSLTTHKVLPLQDDIERLSLAFNAIIEGPICSNARYPTDLTNLTLKVVQE